MNLSTVQISDHAAEAAAFLNTQEQTSLWSVQRGDCAVVTGFSGISKAYIKRMREIGIDVGAVIKCINRPAFSAPRQFQICDGVFSLDMEIANTIKTIPA